MLISINSSRVRLLLRYSVLTVLTAGALSACSTVLTSWHSEDAAAVLVFSKKEGYRHASIPAGHKAVAALGAEHGFRVVATEDASYFSEPELQQYAAVVFLNTTGDVLDDTQQAALKNYIHSGGGFVGIHAASDTEYGWDWYGELVGARFRSHPEIQQAQLRVLNGQHPATKGLPPEWLRKDEWYNFNAIQAGIEVLVEIDESSYQGGENGDYHPIAWYREFEGGRTFYTAMGHTQESWSEPMFLKHVLGGISWAAGDGVIAGPMPDESQFSREVLDANLNEPMQLDELPGIGILFIERRGAIKLWEFDSGETRVLAQLEVYDGDEDGLLGVAVDPAFIDTGWIYLFYSAPSGEPRQHVSRFTLSGGELLLASEKVLLEIPTDHYCCHSGGGLRFGPQGNLFIGVGDNTNPFESDGFAPIDEREGRAFWDAQRSAGNSNDLRGKILRIRPEADGSYSIPDGNLFPPGTVDARPEIYVMGNRNPFRFDIDTATGDLYWGDVGPDAGRAKESRGPAGMGEFNRAQTAGYWGWPYTRGNNQPYIDYDFATEISGQVFDPASLLNDSPNNTGMQQLPPARSSLIWYSFASSDTFPWLGSGGVNPMAGPVFHRDDFDSSVESFPPWFEGTLFLYEWMRDWIYVVRLNASGDGCAAHNRLCPATIFPTRWI
jgi:cytochrome c